MRLPFISRERFEEMKSLLQKQIDDLQEDRRRILDHHATMLGGEPIYSKSLKLDVQPQETVEQTEEQKRMSEVRQAVIATGSRNYRIIAKYITDKRQRAFDSKNSTPSVEAATASLEDAIQQGKEAAKQTLEAQPA